MGAGGTTNGKRILLVIAAAAALAACDGPRDDPSEGAAPGADASQHRPAPSGSCTASYEAEDHLRASAPGFRPMASNRYHPEDFPTHSFDILLAPADG
jgi:hypothetical protein